jgi:hypothetical protein
VHRIEVSMNFVFLLVSDLIAEIRSRCNAASGGTVPTDSSSEMSDSAAPGAHGTDGTARRRKNTGSEASAASENEQRDVPKYTEDQLEAVKT